MVSKYRMFNELAAMLREAFLFMGSILILFLQNMQYSSRKENMTHVLVFLVR